MTKLSLDALRLRAEAVASEDLLATISGGTENACHPNPDDLTGNLPNDIRTLNDKYPADPKPTPGNMNPFRR